MNIQEMIKLWPQYQNWLKQNGINTQNAKEKVPSVLSSMNTTPEQKEQINGILHNPDLVKFAKQFNISDAQINEIQNIFNKNQPTPIGMGNLTQDQLNKIKRLKK